MVLFSNLLFVSNSNGQWLNKYYQVTGKLDRNFLKGFSLIDNMNPVGTYNYTYSKISQKNEVLVKEWFKYQQMKNLSPNDKIKAKILNNYFFKKPKRVISPKIMYFSKKKSNVKNR